MMRCRSLTLGLSFWLGLGIITLQAQEASMAASGQASGSGGTVSYSVGQVAYTKIIGSNGFSLSAGIQQAFEISVATGIYNDKKIKLELSAYPNPTIDYLTLQIDGRVNSSCLVFLYNIHGKLLKKEIVTAKNTKIEMQDLASGTYFLRVFEDKKEVKTFKIIKK